MFVGMVRGAAPVARNEAGEIERATRELCAALLAENHVAPGDVISAIFTVGPDLTAALPAHAAKRAGWGGVPLFSARARSHAAAGTVEIEAHVRLRRDRRLRPVFLGDVASRRPDLAAAWAAALRKRKGARPNGPAASEGAATCPPAVVATGALEGPAAAPAAPGARP